jgi:outer membrane biosynthesis protein TonB
MVWEADMAKKRKAKTKAKKKRVPARTKKSVAKPAKPSAPKKAAAPEPTPLQGFFASLFGTTKYDDTH